MTSNSFCLLYRETSLLLLVLRNWAEVWCEALEVFFEGFAHHLDFATYEAKIGILLADKAEHEAEDGLGHVQSIIVLDKQGLQLVVIECFLSKFDVLVAYVGQNC